MTTLLTLSLSQLQLLEFEAVASGDMSTARDCETIWEAYCDSNEPNLSTVCCSHGGEVHEAAQRVVSVIARGEGLL